MIGIAIHQCPGSRIEEKQENVRIGEDIRLDFLTPPDMVGFMNIKIIDKKIVNKKDKNPNIIIPKSHDEWN